MIIKQDRLMHLLGTQKITVKQVIFTSLSFHISQQYWTLHFLTTICSSQHCNFFFQECVKVLILSPWCFKMYDGLVEKCPIVEANVGGRVEWQTVSKGEKPGTVLENAENCNQLFIQIVGDPSYFASFNCDDWENAIYIEEAEVMVPQFHRRCSTDRAHTSEHPPDRDNQNWLCDFSLCSKKERT